jgi:hypothetical protein
LVVMVLGSGIRQSANLCIGESSILADLRGFSKRCLQAVVERDWGNLMA